MSEWFTCVGQQWPTQPHDGGLQSRELLKRANKQSNVHEQQANMTWRFPALHLHTHSIDQGQLLRAQPRDSAQLGVACAEASALRRQLQSALERKLGLHDSCGVHNLHGMPAILGSIVVSIAVSVPSAQGDVVYPKGDNQAWAQLGGAGATLAFSLASGLQEATLYCCRLTD